jgi:hypothetical protein
LTDDEFNGIIEKLLKIPKENRTLGKFFVTALAKKPSLIIDVAKVYVV